MTENSLRIYCDSDVIIIATVDALDLELASNIITGNRKDEYGDNDEDYKVWYNISQCAYNLWKNHIASTIEVKLHIFKMFPLKNWTEYTKYN